MSTSTSAREFHALHQSGPLILPNAWDAGSARIIEHAGAKAIATSSAAVAALNKVYSMTQAFLADGRSEPFDEADLNNLGINRLMRRG